MKKIIAISVMLALIAGAVFADTAIGGAVEVRFTLARQVGASGAKPVMGGTIGAAQLQLSGSNADGTLGGMFKFKNTNIGADGDKALFERVFVWWKPIQQIKIFLGIDQDGQFESDNLVHWGYHAGDNDYLFTQHWDFWRQIFPGNWDGFGLALSFYPIQGLDLNLVFPTGKVSWRQAPKDSVEQAPPLYGTGSALNGSMLGRIRFSGNYGFDFGKISLVYIGGGAAKEKGVAYRIPGAIDADNYGLLGLSFLVTAIDGMQIKVGGSMYFNKTSDMLINTGIGYAYSGDGFAIKARGGFVLPQKKGGTNQFFYNADVMPSFKVGEKGEVLIDIGLTQQIGLNSGGKSDLGWYVTPAFRLGIDGGAFKVGLQLFYNIATGTFGSDGSIGIGNYKYVKWNIPMLLSFNL